MGLAPPHVGVQPHSLFPGTVLFISVGSIVELRGEICDYAGGHKDWKSWLYGFQRNSFLHKDVFILTSSVCGKMLSIYSATNAHICIHIIRYLKVAVNGRISHMSGHHTFLIYIVRLLCLKRTYVTRIQKEETSITAIKD
jgi:hypothetical protein